MNTLNTNNLNITSVTFSSSESLSNAVDLFTSKHSSVTILSLIHESIEPSYLKIVQSCAKEENKLVLLGEYIKTNIHKTELHYFVVSSVFGRIREITDLYGNELTEGFTDLVVHFSCKGIINPKLHYIVGIKKDQIAYLVSDTEKKELIDTNIQDLYNVINA